MYELALKTTEPDVLVTNDMLAKLNVTVTVAEITFLILFDMVTSCTIMVSR